jgi:hypothetical protein
MHRQNAGLRPGATNKIEDAALKAAALRLNLGTPEIRVANTDGGATKNGWCKDAGLKAGATKTKSKAAWKPALEKKNPPLKTKGGAPVKAKAKADPSRATL